MPREMGVKTSPIQEGGDQSRRPIPWQVSHILSLIRRKPKVLPVPEQFQHGLPPIRGSPGCRTSGVDGPLEGGPWFIGGGG